MRQAVANATESAGLAASAPASDGAAAPTGAAAPPGAGAPPAAFVQQLPAPWELYFTGRHTVACPSRGARFNVYTAGGAGPVVLCLHGGGMTGLSWALLAKLLAPTCRVVAPDLRGHGLSEADDEGDLSAATLAADVAAIWAAACAPDARGGGGAPPPPTVLVGHSLGGAVATRAAAAGAITSLAGLVVIDVVEGTALQSLPFMRGVLQRRPATFASLTAAVEWALRSGTCRSVEAAQVSLPSMLVRRGGSGSGSGSAALAGGGAPAAAAPPAPPLGASAAGGGGGGGADLEDVPGAITNFPGSNPPGAAAAAAAGSRADGAEWWEWRTPLEASAPHWEGWYRGLSAAFLAVPVPKVLILAGTDRLDTALTVAQMQGRFQLVLLPRAGHAVHEDEPDRVAAAMGAFLRRFRVGEPAGAGGGAQQRQVAV
jgi:protein phosphatase methylesterase 1